MIKSFRSSLTLADKAVLACLGLVFVVALIPGSIAGFQAWTKAAPFLSSFIKFALLATFGETLALRLTTGSYLRPQFGILSRALAWGVLGILIKIFFTMYATGTWPVLGLLGFTPAETPSLGDKILYAFTVSVLMNASFGPVLMIAHKISDMHIATCQGSLLRYLSTCPQIGHSLRTLDWNIMWGFVLKKTIPLFWVPAHTITFLLPPYFRVLFAAALGIALGLILAYAGRTKEVKNT